jgi:hypothetical protein
VPLVADSMALKGCLASLLLGVMRGPGHGLREHPPRGQGGMAVREGAACSSGGQGHYWCSRKYIQSGTDRKQLCPTQCGGKAPQDYDAKLTSHIFIAYRSGLDKSNDGVVEGCRNLEPEGVSDRGVGGGEM